MADKRCDNGHFIDETWDICPYCPVEAVEQPVAVVQPRTAEVPRPARPAAAPPKPAAAQPAAGARREPVTAPVTPSAVSAAEPAPMERTVAAQRLESAAQAKRYVVGWLVGLDGSSRGESFALRMGRNVLGRDRRADVVVNDDQASSHHADLVFRPEERRFILMDHNSTNGTYVNDVEITPRTDLSPRDVVRVGNHRYLFIPLCREGFFWDEEGSLR